MTGDDANTVLGANQEHRDSLGWFLYTRPPTQIEGSASQELRAYLAAHTLSERQAKCLVRGVAAHLVNEYASGSFGHGEDSVCNQWLSGACCIAAAITAAVLRHDGCPAWIVGGKPPLEYREGDDRRMRITHWWVHTANGWLLDATWGQYRWCIDPLAVHVSDPRSEALWPLERYTLDDFMSWRGHASLPAENKRIIDKVLICMTGVPYAWQ